MKIGVKWVDMWCQHSNEPRGLNWHCWQFMNENLCMILPEVGGNPCIWRIPSQSISHLYRTEYFSINEIHPKMTTHMLMIHILMKWWAFYLKSFRHLPLMLSWKSNLILIHWLKWADTYHQFEWPASGV